MEFRDRRLSMMIAGSMAAAMASMQHIEFLPEPIDTGRPKKRTTGRKYPFSSKRQNDRYARQIAAGQIHVNA